MTTYDVLVSDDLLPEFTSDNPRLPAGFRVIGPVEGPARYRTKRVRVEDDSAPPWTDGLLINPVFRNWYADDDYSSPSGVVDCVTVIDWTEVTA